MFLRVIKINTLDIHLKTLTTTQSLARQAFPRSQVRFCGNHGEALRDAWVVEFRGACEILRERTWGDSGERRWKRRKTVSCYGTASRAGHDAAVARIWCRITGKRSGYGKEKSPLREGKSAPLTRRVTGYGKESLARVSFYGKRDAQGKRSAMRDESVPSGATPGSGELFREG